MHYVKNFDILGVNTAQIPCIELQGVPNAATEGAVGLLGMNMLSDEHELYVCVAVNGSVYTWKSLNKGEDGVSVVKTEINEDCELIITLSDGTTSNLGRIKGEKGEKGEQADLTQIQEKNKGRCLGIWFGDTETFENLNATSENTMYVLEDDNTLEEIDKAINNSNIAIGELREDVSTNSNNIANITEHITTANTRKTVANGIIELGEYLTSFESYIFYSTFGTFLLAIDGDGRGRSDVCFTGNKFYYLSYESGAVTVYETDVTSNFNVTISNISGIPFWYYKIPRIRRV